MCNRSRIPPFLLPEEERTASQITWVSPLVGRFMKNLPAAVDFLVVKVDRDSLFGDFYDAAMIELSGLQIEGAGVGAKKDCSVLG